METAEAREVESAWSWLRELAAGRCDADERKRAGFKSALAGQMLDLFLPLCTGERRAHMVVAHLGQSLDGRIATRTGASQFITGHADLVHTHRLRALFDAVVVGTRTVVFDNPRLTTRLVEGEHPVRVVLDPTRRLPPASGLFRDGLAKTLLVTSLEHAQAAGGMIGEAEVLGVETRDGRFVIARLLEALRARGLGRVFIEGGGVTVSEFLRAGAIDRLHVAVAPVIMGSGVPSLDLPAIDVLSQALRVAVRHYSLGSDVLFDCDMRCAAPREDQ